jgi:hypothetical protein|tara:strand:- start:2505 stop:3170 length:666 start_codon:yes stop_codon:yes gene_type:complete
MKVQIGIDDLSPRPTQSFELWHNVEKLLGAGLKVDLFVTFAMIRDNNGPFILNKHPSFVERLRLVQEHENIALNVHGYYHSSGPRNNNDEFLRLSKPELDKRLVKINSLINELSLDFKKVFRPPAWKISQDAVNLLVDHGYTHLSLLKGHAPTTKMYNDLDLSKLNIHYCNASPPEIPFVEGDIAATYHFSTHLKNALTDDNVSALLARLKNAEPYHIFET